MKQDAPVTRARPFNLQGPGSRVSFRRVSRQKADALEDVDKAFGDGAGFRSAASAKAAGRERWGTNLSGACHDCCVKMTGTREGGFRE